MKDKVSVFSLASGAKIISKVLEQTDEGFILHYPLEMNVSTDISGHIKMYMYRYMPYNNNFEVLLLSNNVESITMCNEIYRDFYIQKVQDFKKITEPSSFQEEPYEDGTIDSINYHPGNDKIH